MRALWVGLSIALSVLLVGTIVTPAYSAGVMDRAQRKLPVLVENVQDTVQGYLTEEVVDGKTYYYICRNPSTCVYLGTLQDLGMTYIEERKSTKGASNRVDRSTYFFPKDTQYVSILGNWNIYSNNSVSLDLTKPYDMWQGQATTELLWIPGVKPFKLRRAHNDKDQRYTFYIFVFPWVQHSVCS